MYDARQRRQLAEELARAFLDGAWRAEALAERGAAALDPRPAWIDALAFSIVALARTAPIEGPRSVADAVEAFLETRGERPDVPPPQIVRLVKAIVPARRGPLAHDWPIAALATPGALADALELSPGQLEWLADVRGLERTVGAERLRNYRYRWLPRRSGLPRLIEAPKLRLKEVQRWILREIVDGVPPHPAAHGFTRGGSVHTNAAAHVGRAAVLRLDLRDFFPSVPARRVFAIFRTLGYPPAVAHALTGLATNAIPHAVWEGRPRTDPDGPVGPRHRLGRALATPHLPQGAPTSPALANLAAHGLDRRLAALAGAQELHYTRYADDLTFSGAGLTGRRSQLLVQRAGEIAREEGFRLHPGKSQLRTAARRQTVTGIVVNVRPNVARPEYDRLRATLHRMRLDGPGAAHPRGVPVGVDLRAHLHGRIAWVESLHPRRGAKLRVLFDAIDWER